VPAAVARPRPLVSCADSLRIVLPAIIGALHRLIDDFGHGPNSRLPAGICLLLEPVMQEFHSLMCRVGSARLARPRLASALDRNRSTPPFHGTGKPDNFFSLAAVRTHGAPSHCRAPTIKHWTTRPDSGQAAALPDAPVHGPLILVVGLPSVTHFCQFASHSGPFLSPKLNYKINIPLSYEWESIAPSRKRKGRLPRPPPAGH